MKNLIILSILFLISAKTFSQNVGIGTLTPAEKLSVVNANPGYGITHNYGLVTMGTFISNLNAQFGTKTNHPLQFFTNNGNAQMELLTNGNIGLGINGGKVGIGNSNPSLGLDIGTRIRLREEDFHEGTDHFAAFSVAGLIKVTPNLPLITITLESNFVIRALYIEDGQQGEVLVIHCVRGNIIILDSGNQLVPGVFSTIKLKSNNLTLNAHESIQFIFIDGIWSEL